ncbi:hypothetical protein O0L34_g8280 [Tuta absoluta]|nr:hypothetical protein O0L34_g8280 [Tuta absoluta]
MGEAGTSPRTFQKFITNASGTLCFLIVLRMARGWPTVVREVTVIEKSLPRFNQKNIAVTCTTAAALIFSCALLEYMLSIRFYSRLTEACPQGNSQMESYYIYTLPSAAQRIPFTVPSFLLTQVILIQIIMVSNFTDVFIIVISMYLSANFDELNNLVNLYKDKSPNIWNVLRVHYTKLTRLVKIIDESISPFVLFSFGINMMMICIQLFKILRKDLAHATGDNCDKEKLNETLDSKDRSLYFNFSIMFLISRTIFTALFATRVHTSARAPLNALYEVPTSCFNTEARRFVEQIQSNTIALSGQNFFYVTRNMILTMVATVFTYELVLLQFSA